MRYGFKSPLGEIAYEWREGCCHRLWPGASGDTYGNTPVRDWLAAWFAGHIAPLPPLAAPRTPFQARLRAALLDIPFGETVTYGELAERLGTAPRAVGQALGANPLPIIIPCHRILAKDGLGGFACGLEWKQRLLDFERGLQADSVGRERSSL